jgi:TRAP transporter TAXI family solute receptor
MFKFKILIISIVLILSATGCSSQDTGSESSSDNPKQLSVASAGTGGTWYYIGSGIAELLSKHTSGIEATVEATRGGAENVRLITEGSSDIALGLSDNLYFAYSGDDGIYDKAYKNIRLLGAGHTSYATFVTLPNTGIKTLSDLKGSGANVSVGSAGTAAEPLMKAVLEAHGIDLEKDINLQPLSFNEQVAALKDGSLDVARLGGGIPTAALADLDSTNSVVFLNPDIDVLKKLNKAKPYFTNGIIPAGSYEDLTEDYNSPTEMTVAFVDESMSEEIAYKIVKAIYENTDELTKIHSSGAEWSLDNALKAKGEIPYHPGAIKYFKEKGMWEE